ncbi:MAG: hypothetical protein BMS9Abin12_0378 [Acidimicrobiia bacterium]|nr:MAG: hypothetical protein BMS9Abin12_0378 [Acidimicrobiia bacterium]
MRLVLDARTAAFAALIDYAGLFPPASLSMSDAVDSYRSVRSGPTAWIAGRFLCRASQLMDLAAVATSSFAADESAWEVGVIFDLTPGESAALTIDFRSEMDPAMTVAATEARLAEPTSGATNSLLDAMLSVATEVVPFVEVDRSAGISRQVELVAAALKSRRRVGGVKLRCGGVSADMFPTPGEVAEFLMAATDRRLPFKVTAGLHEPIRHFDPDIGTERHGFVNILIAASLAEAGSDERTIESVIADDDPDAFSLSAAFASWRGNEVSGSALRRMRQSGFVAYGSCDFDEPIDSLARLDFVGSGT